MYRITLIEGDFFGHSQYQIKQFYNSLFKHFSFLSWFTEHYQIKIIDKQDFSINARSIKIYTFTLLNEPAPKYLVQFNKNNETLTIQYCILDQFDQSLVTQKWVQQLQTSIKITISQHQEISKLNRKQSQSTKQKQIAGRSTIFIDIEDYNSTISRLGVNHLQSIISLKKKKLRQNQIQYFYKQPLSKRNKETKHCHFNLAFQGGGAKGVSYVGVYKALKELHKHTPITSIIGSSAGGILALAISTEMKPQAITELCLRMDSIPRDKYYKSQSEITAQDQAEFDETIRKIKCLLHNYGILQDSIFDQIVQTLSDIQTSQKILKVLECINPSIAELFSLQLKSPVTRSGGLFQSQKHYTRRFNFYGFLKAGLMKGNAVEDIAAHCLIDYICKHFYQQYRKAHPQREFQVLKIKNILENWGITEQLSDTDLQELLESESYFKKVKKITLKQFYDISGVEFTCTSVDLDDKILRFFNHKTTPNLPVCKTVQMTGSFPVAFQAQKWQRQWGKYYIHYKNTRKEIDLTGHTFTDGGLLANFPIKYLDNELMRPMYFSHRKSADHTILYGFGLDQVQNKLVNQAEQKIKAEAIEDLKGHLSSSISKISLIKNLIMSNSKKKLDQVELKQIPVLDYLIKLINTLAVADYNLNIECFQKSIVVTEIDQKVIENYKSVPRELNKFQQFKDNIQNLYQCSLSKRNTDPAELVRRTCVKVRDIICEYETIQNHVLQRIKNQLLASFYSYQGVRIKYQVPQCHLINTIIKQIQCLYSPQAFKMQDSSLAKEKLMQYIVQIESHFSSFVGERKQQVSKIFSKMIEHQLSIISKIKNRVSQIIQNLRLHPADTIDNQIYNKYAFLDYQIITDFRSMENKFFIVDQPYIQEIMKNIYSLNLPVLKIQNQILQHSTSIHSQLKSIINNNPHQKIHLVLQSKQNSHLYFCGLFEILQNILHKPQHLSKDISMITTSDVHSIFAFLLACGKKITTIRKQMWKVKDLIMFQDNILQQYDTFKWARTSSREMQQLLELTWTDHYQIFGEMQQYLNKSGDQDLANQMKQMRTQFLYSKDVVTDSMESILDYVTKSCYSALKIKDNPQLQKKKLAQYLSLKNGLQGKDYKTKNKSISENTQRFIKMMMIHFQDILVNIILSNNIIKETLDCSNPIIAERAWKGALIKKLLTSKKLQLYIKDKLQQMKLNSNTTLSQFYDFCPRKITLNFTLINKNKERMQIVNRFTRPNIPIWAAIMASTSMPLLLPAVNFLQQWQYSPFADSKMRKLVHYFFSSPEDTLQQSFFSGNYVSTLPLELLTNHKIAKQNYVDPRHKENIYYQQNKLAQTPSTASKLNQSITLNTQQKLYTFITFSFKEREKPATKTKAILNQRSKKFLNFSNLLNIGIDFLRGKFKNIDIGIKDILSRLQILKDISIRIQCHDNTIMKLYYDQTVKLPIALGTLDFYKIEQGKKQILHSCIYQSEFIVRGIFENLWISEDQQSYTYLAKKTTYLQYELCDDKIYLNFISKSKWNRKLATMYKIYWKMNLSDKYQQHCEEQIVISANQNEIYVKFDFPDLHTMNRKSHEMILNFEKLKLIEESVFFKFNYQQLDRRYLIPTPLFCQRLKTRVIPQSKTIITEPKIQDSSAQLMMKTRVIQVRPNKQKLKSIDTKMFQKKSYSHEQKIKSSAYLLVKTLVNFKNDGLLCKGCVKPLVRSQALSLSGYITEGIQVSQCSKCHNKSMIIGYQCKNKSCKEKDLNRYCFSCLFVYMLYIKDGVCKCSQYDHQFQFVSSKSQNQIILCHFCESAANTYYRDQQCNINLCYKCSLILDSRKNCE